MARSRTSSIGDCDKRRVLESGADEEGMPEKSLVRSQHLVAKRTFGLGSLLGSILGQWKRFQHLHSPFPQWVQRYHQYTRVLSTSLECIVNPIFLAELLSLRALRLFIMQIVAQHAL